MEMRMLNMYNYEKNKMDRKMLAGDLGKTP